MTTLATCVLSAVTMVMALRTIEACMCMMEHPQHHACKSLYTIVATINGESVDGDRKYYNFKLNKIFKASDDAMPALKKKQLVTSVHDSLCGVELQVGKTYLIAGNTIEKGQLHLTICNFYQDWSAMTIKQKKGFRLLYKTGCGCKVTPCYWWMRSKCEQASNDTCAWTTVNEDQFDCQNRESVCMMQPTGKCAWNQSFRYRKCLKLRQEEKEKQRALEP